MFEHFPHIKQVEMKCDELSGLLHYCEIPSLLQKSLSNVFIHRVLTIFPPPPVAYLSHYSFECLSLCLQND